MGAQITATPDARMRPMITEAMVEAAAKTMLDVSFGRKAHREPLDWELRMVRAALEAAERAAWQPIETAPRDSRTDIWIARGKQIAVASWFAEWKYCRGGPKTNCWVQPGGAVFEPSPTHWRPLPSPPTDGDKQ